MPEPRKISEAERKSLSDAYPGRVRILTDDEGNEFAFSVPTPAEYAAFRSKLGDDNGKKIAAAWLADTCRKAPDLDGWKAAIADRPGLPDTFAGKLLELAGLGVALTVEKL
jgi:hypothetical protein